MAVLCLAACHRKPELPEYGSVSQFTLTAQDGREFRSQSLAGNIWVADFFFTHCLGPCPRMGGQMRKIEMAAKDLTNVRLVSFTVDPDRDTPAVLAEYSKRFQAETGRWFFLSGPQATLHRLCREDFKLGDVDGSLNHSTRFVLVDPRSRIRGFYDTSEQGSIDKLIADLKALAAERS
jgi:cytochrome oxidase Cu insertion factor (SCO1/SenC/PrrC family)